MVNNLNSVDKVALSFLVIYLLSEFHLFLLFVKKNLSKNFASCWLSINWFIRSQVGDFCAEASRNLAEPKEFPNESLQIKSWSTGEKDFLFLLEFHGYDFMSSFERYQFSQFQQTISDFIYLISCKWDPQISLEWITQDYSEGFILESE